MSISIKALCPHISSAIFKYCVSENELTELGLVGAGGSRGYALQARTLDYLGRLCREREGPSRFLGDLLDMRYLNTVLTVRELDLQAVRELGASWIDDPCGQALPGLIWALCTDPRLPVQRDRKSVV